MDKVYCSNCRYFSESDFGNVCEAPTGKIIKDNYAYKIHKERVNKSVYHENYPNKNGDCKYYKRKWWKFWIKNN